MSNPEDDAYPQQTEWMDEALSEVWTKLGEMPEGLRLYGGAAFALYLGHRTSDDLDWATGHGNVTVDRIRSLMADKNLEGEAIGGPGMVDCTITGKRNVRMTFLECGYLIPAPTQEARPGPLGTLVASPLDLVASKLKCIETRTELRDYVDLAQAERTWPGIITRAAGKLHAETPDRGWGTQCAEPPPEIAQLLSKEDLSTLQKANERPNSKAHSERQR